jgi:predicted CopG family antitoxin
MPGIWASLIKIFITIPDIDSITLMTATTTISITLETKEILRKMGEKGESYDVIIRKLIDESNWKVLDERWNKILKHDEFIPLESL